jgi:catechol 2,3-dioxygenase-like lactoylglutathione lyase family enzyme
MQEVPRPDFKFPGCWFQLGHVQIHATQQSLEAGNSGWAKAGTVTSRGHHIAFAVKDVAKILRIVEAWQVPIASPLQRRPDGFQQLYVYDPDGHLVELVSE